jgi:hypothetical protein
MNFGEEIVAVLHLGCMRMIRCRGANPGPTIRQPREMFGYPTMISESLGMCSILSADIGRQYCRATVAAPIIDGNVYTRTLLKLLRYPLPL